MAELSRRTGLSKATVFNLYHDKTKQIEFETIDKLCGVLACTAADLFEYIPD